MDNSLHCLLCSNLITRILEKPLSKCSNTLREFWVRVLDNLLNFANNVFPEWEHLFFAPAVAAEWEFVVVEFVAIFGMFVK